MIHSPTLPDLVKSRLDTAVALQIACISYASGTTTITEAGLAADLDNSPSFSGRGTGIAVWLWNAASRLSPLQDFASGPTSAKKGWLTVLRGDIERLSSKARSGNLTAFPAANVSTFRERGADFLIQFYEVFRTSRGLPNVIFGDDIDFSGQDYLRTYLQVNDRLLVCPACERGVFYTKTPDERAEPINDGFPRIGAEIDHYFPKSLYPHLSIHPYNLMPVCGYCNGGLVKGDKDPLEATGTRGDLKEIWLPYRERGLGYGTRINANIEPHSFRIALGGLTALPGHPPRHTIETLGHLYKIPDRWREDLHIIESLLFKQMQQFYACVRFDHPGEQVTADTIYQSLKLLINFFRIDRGRTPWSFVMMWWLATLNMEHIEPIVEGRRTRSPLYDEILNWEVSIADLNARGVEMGGRIMDMLR